jgi:transporter family protein
MWVALAFLSALLLGFYDVAKKRALVDNAVMPVLWFNTLFSTLIFLPLIISSVWGLGWFDGSFFEVPQGDFQSHAKVVIKSAMVLTSWIFGYYGMKHLPITIVGPINATRPVLTLMGAMLIFGESLNGWQWAGVLLALFSIFLLSRAGKSEGIDFRHNIWILSVAAAAVVGACCGLYDKHIMRTLDPMFVQGWYTVYQWVMMSIIVGILWLPKRADRPFRWSWAIPLIALFLTCADIAYLTALSKEGALIAVVSMIRRGSVVVSFSCGAMLFREKNLRTKALDLVFILLGMILLYIGSR